MLKKIILIILMFIIVLPGILSFEYVHHDGLRYTTRYNGIVSISNRYETLQNVEIGFSGVINNVSHRVLGNTFRWVWTKTISNYTTEWDTVNNITINKTFSITTFTGNNDYVNFFWVQEWIFNEQFPYAKVSYSITNNLGNDITKSKFWFLHNIPYKKNIIYNNTVYSLRNDTNRHFKHNLDRISNTMILGSVNYDYKDLISNNFYLTDVWIGNSEIIGLQNNNLLVAIAIRKGAGIFYDGDRVMLDPQETSYQSPLNYGDPNNDWLSPSNALTSDNLYATTTVLGNQISLNNFTITLPSDTPLNITGIIVSVEGRPTGPFCGGGT